MKVLQKPKIIYLFIVIFSFLLYGNTLNNGYSLDDSLIFRDNPMIEKGISGLPEVLTTKYVSKEHRSYDYRPIVKISAAIDVAIWKFNPMPSHLVNIILYALLLIVLYHLLETVLAGHDKQLILIILLLFASHPLHTEVVASLKNRDELFSLLFSLLSVRVFLKWIQNKTPKYFFWGLLLFFLAMLSKTSALVFVTLIPLLAYFQGNIKLKSLILIGASLLAVSAMFFAIPQLLLEGAARNPEYFENPLFYEKNLLLKFGMVGMTLWHYLIVLLFPVKLLFYYGFNMIPLKNFYEPLPLLSLLLHLGLLIGGLILLRKKHLVGLGIIYYLIAVSMFSNILIPAVGIVADRFLFNASLGFCFVFGFLLFHGMQFNRQTSGATIIRRLSLVLFIVVIIFYSYRTVSRNQDWKNTLTLYEADIAHLEQSCKANVLYADALFKTVIQSVEKSQPSHSMQKNTERIIFHLQKSIDVCDKYANAWNTLGAVHFMLKKEYQTAKKYFLTALRLNPKYAEAAFNLGHTYENLQQYDSALYYYEKAIQINPKYAMAQNKRILLLFQTGDTLAALKANAELGKMFPQSDIAHINLGNYYFLSGDTAQAFIEWEKAIEKVPENPGLLEALIQYFTLKNQPEKVNHYRQILNNLKKKQKKGKAMPQFL